MKHYIYLTEDKLYYIRKENRARGYSFMGSRTITGPETVTGAMESLADIYNLKGRAVVLAIEASVKIHFMSLPASSKKTALQMAEKQLLVLGEEGERLLAADFMPNNGQGMLKGTVYTVSGAWIRAIETGALITRFRIHSILPGPALLASFLEPSDYGMNKGTVIFVHLADQSIVFYQMENGHCRHLEHSSLKPGMFAYLGEDEAMEVVVNAPNRIVDTIETGFGPYPQDTAAPREENGDALICSIARKGAEDIYGAPLPEIVEARL